MLLFFMVGLNLKARLQYGRSFLYDAMYHVLAYSFEFLAVWLILNKFTNVGGWSFFEILFLHALAYFIRATTAALVWDSMSQMSNLVRDGKIDRFLVAPINSFYYLLGTNFGVWSLSHIAFGAGVTIIAAFFLNIHWTLTSIVFLIMGILAGVLIFSSLIIIGGALSFWTVRSNYFLWILLDTMPLINYPISIYPKMLQSVLTFIIPIALINYFPTSYILGKSNISGFMMLAILISGLILIWLSYKFWWLGTKHYQGTGS